MITGKVALKMRYLGSAHVGQDLCWCVIRVAQNAVSVVRYRDGRQMSERWYDQVDEVNLLKSKLRAFAVRMKTGGRWSLHSRNVKGQAELVIYYPSGAWEFGCGRVRWMGDDTWAGL